MAYEAKISAFADNGKKWHLCVHYEYRNQRVDICEIYAVMPHTDPADCPEISDWLNNCAIDAIEVLTEMEHNAVRVAAEERNLEMGHVEKSLARNMFAGDPKSFVPQKYLDIATDIAMSQSMLLDESNYHGE
jgi:hypothetical protein